METQEASPVFPQPPLSITRVKTSSALFFGHIIHNGMIVTKNQIKWKYKDAVSTAGKIGAPQVLKKMVMTMIAIAMRVYFQLAKTKSKLKTSTIA